MPFIPRFLIFSSNRPGPIAVEATLQTLHQCRQVETVIFACFDDSTEAALIQAAGHHNL